ncbi:MAG: hypothetical protein ABI868_05865 [Acidobacteriota bacterium]
MLIAVVRTAGTVVGDYLRGEERVDLGVAVGASFMGARLLAILLIPSAWKAAERRWPTLGAASRMARNDLVSTVERIDQELRSQYLLTFRSSSPDGRAHRIRVRTRASTFKVRARRSYLNGR